jgi:hypothetical protein
MDPFPPDHSAFEVMKNADVTVERADGSRGADGYTGSDATTVLTCRADVQQVSQEYVERVPYFETGGLKAYLSASARPAAVGDTVTIDRDDGPTRTGTVESVDLDSDVLMISTD